MKNKGTKSIQENFDEKNEALAQQVTDDTPLSPELVRRALEECGINVIGVDKLGRIHFEKKKDGDRFRASFNDGTTLQIDLFKYADFKAMGIPYLNRAMAMTNAELINGHIELDKDDLGNDVIVLSVSGFEMSYSHLVKSIPVYIGAFGNIMYTLISAMAAEKTLKEKPVVSEEDPEMEREIMADRFPSFRRQMGS